MKILRGDVDNSLSITNVDKLLIARHITVTQDSVMLIRHADWELNEAQKECADVDCSGEINAKDKLMVARHIAAENDPIIQNRHEDWIIN